MGKPKTSRILLDIYDRLLARYARQHWWPAREPFEVIVGAILTQSAAWSNVEKAISGLRGANALSPAALRRLPREELAGIIHSCGYYNAKARKLQAFARWFGERYGDDISRLSAVGTARLRQELLGVYGIGEETADSIILYAAGQPVFVIDAYTRRILSRIGLFPAAGSYAACQELFMAGLPADAALFNEYHALLVRLGKEVCRPTPRCPSCCLNDSGAESNTSGYPCSALLKG